MELKQCEELLKSRHSNNVIVWADHGQINHVAIVDSKFVYKFPRTDLNKKILAFEADNYKLFTNLQSVQIPRVIELAEDLSFGVFTYVKGKFLSVNEVLNFTKSEQLELAVKVSEFVKEINQQTYKLKFKALRQKHTDAFPHGDDEITGWLKEVVTFAQANKNKHTSRYLDLYTQLKTHSTDKLNNNKLLTHNDLHNENMLFDDNNKLIGIIDFGDMRFDNLSAELRTIYRFGEAVIIKLLELLRNFNKGDDLEGIRLFAITYEYGIFIEEKYMKTRNRPDRLGIAIELLKEWGEL